MPPLGRSEPRRCRRNSPIAGPGFNQLRSDRVQSAVPESCANDPWQQLFPLLRPKGHHQGQSFRLPALFSRAIDQIDGWLRWWRFAHSRKRSALLQPLLLLAWNCNRFATATGSVAPKEEPASKEDPAVARSRCKRKDRLQTADQQRHGLPLPKRSGARGHDPAPATAPAPSQPWCSAGGDDKGVSPWVQAQGHCQMMLDLLTADHQSVKPRAW